MYYMYISGLNIFRNSNSVFKMLSFKGKSM